MRQQSLSDQSLLFLYQSGDKTALQMLFSRYEKQIFSALFYWIGNKQAAEDLLQETFIKALIALDKGNYQEAGKFPQWLMRIGQNLCRDYRRRAKCRPKPFSTDNFYVWEQLVADDHFETPATSHSQLLVYQLIAKLPPEQQEIVVLRYYADLSFREIAELTGVNLNTALARLHYALKKIRRMLNDKMPLLD